MMPPMKKPIFFALLICVLAILWLLSGLGSSGNNKTEQPTAQNFTASGTTEELVEVRVRNLQATKMQDTLNITGRTQASRFVQLKSETSGQIAELLAEKGTQVIKGQRLARLHIKDRAAKVLEAEKLLSQRQIQYQAAAELAERGFNSRVRLAEAKAELEAATSALKQAKVELSNININSPFNGVLSVQHVELGDYVTTGENVFDLVNLDPIEISAFVTEQQLPHIKEGTEITAQILNNQEISGKITFVSPTANIQTRTFQIEAAANNPDHIIKEGLTAQIQVPIQKDMAYQFPSSILTLSDDGTVGVKLVTPDDKVSFHPVTILKDNPDYIWVGGLPDNIQVITVGQEFVIDGQTVKPVQENTISDNTTITIDEDTASP